MHRSEEASYKKTCVFLLVGCADAFEEHEFELSAQIYFLLPGTRLVRNRARLIFDLNIQDIVCIEKIFS